MNKKTVITIVIVGIIAVTIITSLYGKNPIYNYVKNRYFPDVLNLDEQFGVKNYKTGNQTIETGGYTMVMDQYFWEDDKSAGYLRIKVMRHDLDMREMETDSGNDENLFNFGLDDTRYFFATDVKGEKFKKGITACTSYQKIKAIQTKKAMYIYFKFCSEDGGIYNGKVFLHDRKAQKGMVYSDYAGKEKYAIGVFDLTK